MVSTMEIPLPTPLSVIRSPIHIRNALPAVNAAITVITFNALNCSSNPCRPNPIAIAPDSINVSDLERFENGATVDVNALVESGVVKNPRDGVKILGNGELTKKLNVKVSAYSASAKEKIEALGGTAEVM